MAKDLSLEPDDDKSSFSLDGFSSLLTEDKHEEIKDFFESEIASMSAGDVEKLCSQSLDFLAGVCLPDTCTALFPPIYQNIWSLFIEALTNVKGVDRYAIGLPRGHAKTVFLKLLCLYIILYTNRQFILIICATVDLASNFIIDVCSMLGSPNIVAVFGNYKDTTKTENKELVRFSFRGRDVILKPIGSGSAVRGVNIENRRPDVEIFDDMQTRENARSVTQARELQQWMVGTVMKARDPKRCLYIYVGNMYASVPIDEERGITTCILHNLKNNVNWKSWIVGAILANGEALWPEVRPITDLLEELENDRSMGEEDQFYSEVLNDPTAGNLKLFDITKIKKCDIDFDVNIPNGKFIIIDPSLNKKKSDRMPVAYCEVYDNVVYCKDLELTKLTPRLMVRHVIERAVSEGYFCIISEAQAMQELLIELFNEILDSLNITDLVTLGITGGGETKASRIATGARQVLNAEVVLNYSALTVYNAEMQNYDPAKTNNQDDVIDIVGYLAKVPVKFPTEIMARDYVMYMLNQERDDGQEQDFTNSSFGFAGGFEVWS